jgi:hypothetical protein
MKLFSIAQSGQEIQLAGNMGLTEAINILLQVISNQAYQQGYQDKEKEVTDVNTSTEESSTE